MRIGFQLVIYIIILNMICGLVYTLGVPGVEYSSPPIGTGSEEDYEDRFNPGTMINQTQPSVWAEFPFLGNIYAVIMTVWNAINFVIMGFPQMLESYVGLIGDAAAQTAYTAICWVIRAAFSFVIFMWLFQIITGRHVED